MDNPNCGRCGHLNMRGYCNLTACMFPMRKTEVLNIKKPMTNGDRIRSMSDEELADEYIRIYSELPKYSDSWAWLREWLKQEAKEDA